MGQLFLPVHRRKQLPSSDWSRPYSWSVFRACGHFHFPYGVCDNVGSRRAPHPAACEVEGAAAQGSQPGPPFRTAAAATSAAAEVHERAAQDTEDDVHLGHTLAAAAALLLPLQLRRHLAARPHPDDPDAQPDGEPVPLAGARDSRVEPGLAGADQQRLASVVEGVDAARRPGVLPPVHSHSLHPGGRPRPHQLHLHRPEGRLSLRVRVPHFPAQPESHHGGPRAVGLRAADATTSAASSDNGVLPDGGGGGNVPDVQPLPHEGRDVSGLPAAAAVGDRGGGCDALSAGHFGSVSDLPRAGAAASAAGEQSGGGGVDESRGDQESVCRGGESGREEQRVRVGKQRYHSAQHFGICFSRSVDISFVYFEIGIRKSTDMP